LERTVEIGFDGYAIGGLSVGEPRPLSLEMVEVSEALLPRDRPRCPAAANRAAKAK